MHRRRIITAGTLAALASLSSYSQTVEERITTLLNQMTVQEKILQLHQNPDAFSTADNARFGIRGFFMADGPHGVREGAATSFPVGIGMAATWDTDLARRVGTAMGREFRGKGKSQGLGPCLDLDRDPRNGRSPETGGEDPFLNAQITSNVTRGMQSTGCLATVKHFNANHRELGRYTNNVAMNRRDMEEQSGLAFRTAIQEGGALSVMNAYNLINGEKCAENTRLLTDVLRNDWGFPYYVVSDWNSIFNSEKAIKAGCDICMGSDKYKNDLPGLVAAGTVTHVQLDAAVRRVLRTKIVAGLTSYLPPGRASDVGSVDHQTLCLEAGRKSIVLLKNQGTLLPLSDNIGSITLIGPNAAELRTDGSGSSWVTPFAPVTPKAALEQRIGVLKVKYTKGCDVNSADTSGFATARTLAASSDVVIFVGGLDPSQEGERDYDRASGSVDLPGRQQDMIQSLASANPNIVVVLFSGGICSVGKSIGSIKSLLYAFYPGEKAGRALAEVLFGDVNPSGKLPVSMPVNDAQLPPWNDDFTDGDEGGGYRWFDRQGITPLAPFGFGMSYTTFAYTNLNIAPQSILPGEPVKVSVDITNTGARGGEEIAQLYLSHGNILVPLPVKQLKGFQRVSLDSGETKTVDFTLTADEFYYFNEASGVFDFFPGNYTVRVGGSSASLPLNGTITMNDGARRPDLLITSLRLVPPYPVVGDSVTFLAAIKNRGSEKVSPGTPLTIEFSVNGQRVSWCTSTTTTIPTGGMALLEANAGPSPAFLWRADSLGLHSVTATLDPENTIDEILETNNAASLTFAVLPTPPKNLALLKPVTVTSIEGPGYEGSKAVDGSPVTRWSSQFSDPQSITIDLGARTHIDSVLLRWEAAYASEYYITVSDDNAIYSVVRHEQSGHGGTEVVPVNAEARYVRMIGMRRATVYGYSLYEFEVYGSPATAILKGGMAPDRFGLDQNFPNPFNPSTTIGFTIPTLAVVTVTVYDILGREIATLLNEKKAPGSYLLTFDATGLASGVYMYRLAAGIPSASQGPRAGMSGFVLTRKMVVVK